MVLVLLYPVMLSAQSANEAGTGKELLLDSAPVIIDGRVLFHVRGIRAYPAKRRAGEIAERIEAFAADTELDPKDLRLQETENAIEIRVGDDLVARVYDADAEIGGVQLGRSVVANTALTRIREAITEYRKDRRSDVLLVHAGYALGMTLMAVAVFVGGRWGFRKFSAWVEQRMPERLEVVEARSFNLVQADQLWRMLRGTVRLFGLVVAIVLGYLYLNAVLSLFPWTRLMATRLFDVLVDPLHTVGAAILGYLPNLVFLIIIIVIFRYVLKLLNALFGAISRKRIVFTGFDAEWAWPTYRLVRVLVLAFALIVAYPYIPGSDSAAFKGVSLFLGVLASIGSSSIISNVVAGYSMTYRRAFRVGDRVRIGETVGDVTDTRLLVTHVRTPKNEAVVIPNSVILNGEVTNYSSLAKEKGLILHTMVGIGYEVPRRQVEAMLLLAAKRTPGIATNREAFVLKKSLGDFAITYELNVYVDNAEKMNALYSALHDRIIDVFNEYGVAIMTPSYDRDPEEPKLVPREQWYATPAEAPAPGTS
ncbi:MAG: mechanosensitive ion channel domain-containing protein [Pseudomonadota bacterium]